MIDPQTSAKRILQNDPSLAEPLFDLLLWANQPNLGDQNDYDDVLDLVFKESEACRKARDAYAKERAA